MIILIFNAVNYLNELIGPNNCLTCTKNTCASCDDSLNRLIVDNTCLCKAGYFENGNEIVC